MPARNCNKQQREQKHYLQKGANLYPRDHQVHVFV